MIYNVNVTPAADKTMKAVSDQLPNEPALFIMEPDMSKWQKTLEKADAPKGCLECDMFLEVYNCYYKTPAELILKWNYKLPKWVEVGNASEEAQKEWKRFKNACEEHEDGHKKIAETFYKNLLTLLNIMGIGKSHHKTLSETLAYKAFNITESQFPEYFEQQADYDETTRHGHTQGVYINTAIKLK